MTPIIRADDDGARELLFGAVMYAEVAPIWQRPGNEHSQFDESALADGSTVASCRRFPKYAEHEGFLTTAANAIVASIHQGYACHPDGGG
jgi:hypothetical protein